MDVEHFIAELIATRAASTARIRYTALRQFFRWLVAQGERDVSPMEQMRSPRTPVKPLRVASEVAVEMLLKATDGRAFQDRRDRAIIRLMIDCGLERREIATLTVDDIAVDGSRVVLRRRYAGGKCVSVVGQGAKELGQYLRSRSEHVRHTDAALFIGRRGALTGNGVYKLVERVAARAQIPPVNPNELRAHSQKSRRREWSRTTSESDRTAGE